MKKIFACLLLLMLAVPACAEENGEDELYHDMIVIMPNAANEDNEAMPAIIRKLMQRVNNPQVLGDAASKVVVIPGMAIQLEIGGYSLKKFPQLQEYKKDVSESYNALKMLKQKPEFAQGGLNTAAGKAWQNRNDTLNKKYERVQLPSGYTNAFIDLDVLASDYMYIRHAKNFSVSTLNSWEDTSFIARHRIENTVNMIIDD